MYCFLECNTDLFLFFTSRNHNFYSNTKLIKGEYLYIYFIFEMNNLLKEYT